MQFLSIMNRNLLSLNDLSKKEILELIEFAKNFKLEDGSFRKENLFPDKTVANVFCEPSTRTKSSFEIAAKNKTGLTELLTALKSATAWTANSTSQTIVTNARHADALRRTAEALQKSIEAVELSIPGDLLAQDLRLALDGLGEITGTISTDDLLANIFSKFCIGK